MIMYSCVYTFHSMEDIPIGAHPSLAPGRVTFGDVDVEVKVRLQWVGVVSAHVYTVY